jgi:ribosomal-protein-alanine N-acetyltransferase
VYVVEDYGYALGVLLGGEVELLRIGVLPECRGQGRGFALMSAFLEKSRAKCDGVVYLEVASKNAHAVKLYEKCGFTETRRRRGYYNDGDDAIIMEYRPALSEHDNRD